MGIVFDDRTPAIDQYSFPLCSELSGRELILVAPKKKYTLKFEDETLLTFSESGTASCRCLKLADQLYFVTIGQNSTVAVIDLKERLATLVMPDMGYAFCAIEQDWKALPETLHCETDELVGTGLRWNFGSEFYSKQVYFSVDRCRMTWSPENYRFDNFPARYTRIREKIYLVDINARVPAGSYVPRGYDRFFMLQDYDKLLFVGAAFSIDDAAPLMLSGFGETDDLDPTLFGDD